MCAKAIDADSRFSKGGSGHFFKGRNLTPFNPRRQSLAWRMGMRYGMLSEEDQVKLTVPVPGNGRKKTVDIFVYRDIFADAVMVVWLCLQPEHRIQRAERLPEEAVTEMWKWAQDEAVNIGSPIYAIVQTLFTTILAEIAVAQSTPVPRNPSEGDDDDEENVGE
jgi:hypothetical protein